MSNVSDYSVRTRIWGGYGLVLSFLLVVTALGFFALQKIGGNVDEYDRVADNTVRIMMVDRNVAGLRRNVLLFTGGNGDERALGRIRDLEAALRKDITDAASATHSAERKAILQELATQFERYAANFEKVVDLTARRKAAVEGRMNPLGASMRQTLTEIGAAAFTDGKFENAAQVGMAQESLMLARLNAVRFVSSPDQKLVETVREQAKSFYDRVNELQPHLVIPANIERTKQAIEDGKKYVVAFEDVAKITLATDRIINTENAAIANRIGELAGKLRQSQVGNMKELGTEAIDTVSTQQKISTGLSVLALLLGLSFALVIARSIIRPVEGVRKAMADLAEGHLEVTVPHTADKDELGEMARTVEMFKEVSLAAVRAASGLDRVSANAMMADTRGIVTYVNPSLARPIRASGRPRSRKNADNVSGSLATFASRTILPLLSTTHTLLCSRDTSIPA